MPNNVVSIKRAAEVNRITEFSKPNLAMFDKKYMKKAHEQALAQRKHDARVQTAWKKARAYEHAMERDFKRIRTTGILMGIFSATLVLLNVWGMWGGQFG